MKIHIIPKSSFDNENTEVMDNNFIQSEVAILKVHGEADTSNVVLQDARKLIETNGTREMVESFDWAVSNNAFFNDK